MSYTLPIVAPRPANNPQQIYLVASGDLRETANRAGWPAQEELEANLKAAFADLGHELVRANPVDPGKGHGFISSQRMGMEVFRHIPVDARLVVAEAVWQYSHHVLAGLRDHQGPILTAANFAGQWPGLVGLLNLNASLTKMGKPYSTVWSVDFKDDFGRECLEEWLTTGRIRHDESFVRPLPTIAETAETALGIAVAHQLKTDHAIMGVFDEGCMGMYNAIFDDEVINPLGIYKERLSQSALWAEMRRTPDAEAAAVVDWLTGQGMTFKYGTDPDTELSPEQVLWQAKMYISALRIADDFGLDIVGIQYQQGLKDLCPASDLAEGLLNNVHRPPVVSRDGSRVLYEGRALPCFNEADEGSGVDALVTNRVWVAMGLDPATTLHDVRWGDTYQGEFVWVFEISGSVPPSHFARGYADAEGWRQDPVYFPLGGSTIRGVSKPGEIVWSRAYLVDGKLNYDIGRGTAIELPAAETERRWQATNPEWPIQHVVLHGITRDQFMGHAKANHIQVAYAPDAATADQALLAKATAFAALGVKVHLCGDVSLPA